MKTYDLTTDYETCQVYIKLDKYMADDSLAIELVDAEDNFPFARLTVCLPEEGIARDNLAFVDTNNCPWATRFLQENELGVPTGALGISGFCSYPLFNFNLEKLKAN